MLSERVGYCGRIRGVALLLLALCETTDYGEAVDYVRLIVRMGNPVRVREDYSVLVAGKEIRYGLRRVLPASYGRVEVKGVYDNTRPMAYREETTDGSTVIFMGDRCLFPGKHRITLEYEVYPRSDTLWLGVLNGDFPLPVDYVEVVVVPDTSEFPVVIPPKGFREEKVQGFYVVRITGDGPFPPGERVNVGILLPSADRYARPHLLALLVAFLLVLHVLSAGLRRA